MSISLGILGFAHAHVNSYCAEWRKRDDVQIVAGWDHDAARAKKSGMEMAASLADVLARVDAVVIAAETSMHAELVEQAAAAGKAIVLQKPMALTLAEADRMVAAVKQAGVPFTMAWQMRVDPQNLRMRQLAREGALGRILMVRRRHGLATQKMANFADSWYVQTALNRGLWADDAAHAIDFIYWLLGKPESVTAEIGTLLDPKVPDDHGIAIFRFADGAFAEVVSSFTCLAGENTTEIVGDRGVAIQNYGDAPSCNAPRPPGGIGLKWFLDGGTDWIESGIPSPSKHGERIAALAAPLADFLRGKRPAIATADEGREVLRMTLACYESASQGKRIRFS